MGRGETDMNPMVLKTGLAIAFSLGGMVYTFFRQKRIKPSQSPSDPSNSSDSYDQVVPAKESHKTPISRGFDPLENDKHEELGILNADKDNYLLPEFNDLVKEFNVDVKKTNTELPISDAESNPNGKDSDEQEIKSLRNTVKSLKEREKNLEIQLLEYYGLKEQENAVMELKNRLKLNSMEAKLFTLKIESLQADNKRLEAQMEDHKKVLAELEAARTRIKSLKKKLRSETTLNKEHILSLQQRLQKMQEDEHKGDVKIDPEVQSNLQKLKDLEGEAEELRKSNKSLQLENSELAERLEHVQIVATSVLKDDETEKLKEEIRHLKKQNEDVTKEIEQLQANRCDDVEELVYLRWINACLRYELRNYQPEPGKTVARDLSKTLSPESEKKAKQLILEYANKEGVAEKGINIQELDSDLWSNSQNSSFTDSGEPDETSVDRSSPRKTNNQFFGKLMKLLRGKDSHSPNHHHRHDHRHSRSSSLDDASCYSDLSFGHVASSSKTSMDSQKVSHRYSDLGGSMGVHKRIDSIAEGGDVSGGLGSPSSLDSRNSDVAKYAEVLKNSNSKWSTKFRRRSTPFSTF